MNSRTTITAIIGIVLVAALGAGAWYLLRERPVETCQVCGRVIHADMRTVAKVDGKTVQACCVRCVLTLRSQTGDKIRFLRVTDFDTGEHLSPEKAFYVDGSDVELCSTPAVKPGEELIPSERMFDRCAPSVNAFSTQDEARTFIAQHGGTLKTLDQLIQEAASAQGSQGEHHHD